MNKNTAIAVAVSGGIDSLVSGYLIKQQFDQVFGLHFITGYEKSALDIGFLEKQLGFPVYQVDLSDQFDKKVVHYFTTSYLKGRTPNPCAVCNKEIKFGQLLQHARKKGAELLATGHYAGISGRSSEQCCLIKGKDPLKDQSYFLGMLSQEQLNQIFFPLADWTKEKVREFAADHHLTPIHKKESQDICFIHENNFKTFILNTSGYSPVPGDIVDMNNQVIGRHTGLHQYTIGQRRGINCPAGEPYYVCRINMKQNQLHVCFKEHLFKPSFNISQIVWNRPADLKTSDPEIVIQDVAAKIRYGHKGERAALTLLLPQQTSQDGTSDILKNCIHGHVVFSTPQKAVTPGQTAVFYQDEKVLGAGVIQ